MPGPLTGVDHRPVDEVPDKARLRRTLRERRCALTPAERAGGSTDVCLTLLALPVVERARVAAAYVPVGHEVDVSPVIDALLAEETTVLLPRVRDDDRLELVRLEHHDQLREGYGGVLEPTGDATDLARVDVVLVPGVGFDRDGTRLGRGGGHYDRLLADLPARTVRIGVAFEVQVVDALPRDGHDEPVHALVTERGVVRTTAAARLPRGGEHRILPGG